MFCQETRAANQNILLVDARDNAFSRGRLKIVGVWWSQACFESCFDDGFAKGVF